MPTTEAEYLAANEVGKEMFWLKMFFFLGTRLKQELYVVYCDSQSVMDLNMNATYHTRPKYVDVRYHWTCEVIDKSLLKLKKIHINKNPLDMMTKLMSKGRLDLCSDLARLNSQ